MIKFLSNLATKKMEAKRLHYCFKTRQPIPLNIWLVILRDEGSDDDMDRNYKMGFGWNNDFDSPRVIAILQNSSVVTWIDHQFDSPETIANLRSKLGLPPLSKSDLSFRTLRRTKKNFIKYGLSYHDKAAITLPPATNNTSGK